MSQLRTTHESKHTEQTNAANSQQGHTTWKCMAVAIRAKSDRCTNSLWDFLALKASTEVREGVVMPVRCVFLE